MQRRLVISMALSLLGMLVLAVPLFWRFSAYRFKPEDRGLGGREVMSGRAKQPVIFSDLDGNGSTDILTFSQGEVVPLWRGFTLDGIEGANVSAASGRGIEGVWHVGDNLGLPVPGDYNADGLLDLATFTPGNLPDSTDGYENWRIFLSAKVFRQQTEPIIEPQRELRFSWGHSDELPVPEDYDGDRATDVAVFEPNSGMWSILFSSGGFNRAKALLQDAGYGEVRQWGLAGDVPLPGDYDGDGRADFALWRASPSKASKDKGEWWIAYRELSGNGTSAAEGTGRKQRIEFGTDQAIPVPADYNGDGVLDIAVFEPRAGQWRIRGVDGKVEVLPWSVRGGRPFAADFDGDGRADPAFFVGTEKYRFEILNSRFAAERQVIGFRPPVVTRLEWGNPEEKPVALWLRRGAV